MTQKPMTPLRWIGLALYMVVLVAIPLALLAIPTCIIYWWGGMSGDIALTIDIGSTALIVAGIVTAAYYAD